MLPTLHKYLIDKIILSEEEILLIDSVTIIKKLRKKQFLVQQGELWKFNAFVSSGLVKTFSVDKDGKEHIINFSPEDHWFGDRESLTNGTPTRFNIDAVEDSEVVLVKKEDFEMLCSKIPALNGLVNSLLQKSFLVSQNRIHASISLTAEEKYRNFLDSYPYLANRIPQHMIAAYLGITPETITRARRNNHKK
ncbi:Transcriptional activator protein Anr [compost metagenome]